MLAFKAAIDGNFDGVETDVQLTKDNRLVLIHDEKIDRTSNGKGYVKDYTMINCANLILTIVLMESRQKFRC